MLVFVNSVLCVRSSPKSSFTAPLQFRHEGSHLHKQKHCVQLRLRYPLAWPGCTHCLWNLPHCVGWMSSTRDAQNRKVNSFSGGFIWRPLPVQNQRHLQNHLFAAPFFSVLPSVAPLLGRRSEHLGKQPAWSFICGSSSYTEQERLLTFSKEHFRTSYRLCLLLLRICWPFKEKEFRMQLGCKNNSFSSLLLFANNGLPVFR